MGAALQPFAPFSQSDRVGRAGEWNIARVRDRRQYGQRGQFGQPAVAHQLGPQAGALTHAQLLVATGQKFGCGQAQHRIAQRPWQRNARAGREAGGR